jgi:hypothetical protein
VCTGHCTVQCPVHRQPRAKMLFFLCAVRWFTGQLLCAVRCAPESHCRLSGVPISRFKKTAPSPTGPEASCFPASARALCPAAISPPPAISTGGDHPRWAPATSPVLFPSVSSSPLPSFSLLSVSKPLCHPIHHPPVQIQISVKSHASNW